ncbi:GntR family transcriptional regulator [Nocardia pseudovaccinii]|uniref:GntR family transcriptional regulator n=1 Tax=Nocardia pseudovaccinii TaxID=189540 RepID=UPI003D8EFAB7
MEYKERDGGRRKDRTKRLAVAVYDDVKSRILSGDYAPGTWLPVDELAQAFEVSRQPVMEAMRRLSGDWLVEIAPQVGCRVAEYDPRAVNEFITIFGEMEGSVAALAAERRTPRQLAWAESLCGEIGQIVTRDDHARQLMRGYHDVILQMAHSSVLERLCEQSWDFASFAGMTIAPPEDEPETLRRQGNAIKLLTEAIREKNGPVARLHMTVWLTGLHSPRLGQKR